MEALRGVLQARLQLPQASQLAQCLLGCAKLTSDARYSSTGVVTSSQVFSATRMVGSRDAEPCVSGAFYGYSSRGVRGANVVCMVRERRLKMVTQQIRREISTMLLYDKVLQAAILPETALGADMFLSAVATISDVEMSKDLSVAKVYISIYGDERGQEKALEGLKNKAWYVRKGLAQRMNLKNTPEVRFIKDDSLERGSRVIGLLDKLKKERQLKEAKYPNDGVEVEDGEDDNFEYHEDLDKAAEKKKTTKSWASSDDDGDESDWDDDENITFIK